MPKTQDPIQQVAHLLETKSRVKQQTYRTLCKQFKLMELQAKEVIAKIRKEVEDKDPDIDLKVSHINDQEFHVHVAGDMLIFLLHTNIITLQNEHGYSKSDYVNEDPYRRYLGQIVVYNFMADSLKYHRLKDPGYLIARMFLNYENHFLVEGEGQLNFLFDAASPRPITDTDLSIFIQLVISQSIENDLITPPFPTIRTISLQQKAEKTQALGGGYKIGFQMSYQQSDIK